MVAHVITEQTNMMYGRHLDQVILCALYGVCKVNQLRQITFKDIITHYKKQAQAKNAIFRTVSIRLRPDLSVRYFCLSGFLGDLFAVHDDIGLSICANWADLLVASSTCMLGSQESSLIGTSSVMLLCDLFLA